VGLGIGLSWRGLDSLGSEAKKISANVDVIRSICWASPGRRKDSSISLIASAIDFYHEVFETRSVVQFVYCNPLPIERESTTNISKIIETDEGFENIHILCLGEILPDKLLVEAGSILEEHGEALGTRDPRLPMWIRIDEPIFFQEGEAGLRLGVEARGSREEELFLRLETVHLFGFRKILLFPDTLGRKGLIEWNRVKIWDIQKRAVGTIPGVKGHGYLSKNHPRNMRKTPTYSARPAIWSMNVRRRSRHINWEVYWCDSRIPGYWSA
jgi:hypothetical protein